MSLQRAGWWADQLQRLQAVWAAMPEETKGWIRAGMGSLLVAIGGKVFAVMSRMDPAQSYAFAVGCGAVTMITYAVVRAIRTDREPQRSDSPEPPAAPVPTSDDFKRPSTFATLHDANAIKGADVRLDWKPNPNGLDVTATSQRPEAVHHFKLFLSDLLFRSSGGRFGQVPEFHTKPFEEVQLPGVSSLFCEVPEPFAFLSVDTAHALRYQGSVNKVGRVKRELTRGGIWQATFTYKSQFQGRKVEHLYFEWTPGDAPRPWEPKVIMVQEPIRPITGGGPSSY